MRLRPVALSTVMLACAAVAAPQAEAASPTAKDGFWNDPSGKTNVQVLVVGGRVVAARGSVETKPVENVPTATCGRFTFSFVGPLDAPANASTTERFSLDEDFVPWSNIKGRIRSATKITGTLTHDPAGHGDYCRGQVRFSLSPA